MIWIDVNYTKTLGLQLDRFKVLSSHPFKANCRCPYCGDSQTSKYKARGYFYEANGSVKYHCHNCGVSKTLKGFLYEHNPALLKQYSIETFVDSKREYKADAPQPAAAFKSDMSKFAKRKIDSHPMYIGLKKVSQLPVNHPTKQYVVSRMIPASQHWRFYHVPNFFKWAQEQRPDKWPHVIEHDEPRLVMPFVDRYGDVFGFQGRSLNADSKRRFVTQLDDDDQPALFGFETVDLSQPIYSFEGAIDSAFIRNAVAQCGGEPGAKLAKYLDFSKTVFVLDNEPRHVDTCTRLQKLITDGRKVVIWPEGWLGKDVNEMVKNHNVDPEELNQMLPRRTFHGLRAQLEFNNWIKIDLPTRN